MMSPRMRIAKASIVVAAAISFFLSIFLWFSGSREQAIFVGIWVPSILSFGALIFAGMRSPAGPSDGSEPRGGAQ